MYKIHEDFPKPRRVTAEELEAACDMPVLKKDCVTVPVMIKAFELIHNRGMFFLRITSVEGDTGVSAATGKVDYLYPLLRELILPFFIGKDARELESLLDQVYVHKSNYKLAGLAYWCCISWVETAVLDLLGQVSKKSVPELLGEVCRDEVDIYVASGNRGTTPQEETDILARRVAETGARAIKFKLGGRMSRNADSMEGRTEGLLHMARNYFGDGMIIHTDGNGSYDAAHGIAIGRICEEIGAYFYEEPCPFDDLWDTKAVADALDIPLAFGEQETSLRRFRWIIENDAADVLQPDLQYNGGFIKTTKVARMAEAAGKVVTPHVSGGVTAVYMLLFAAYIPNLGKYQEYKSYDGCEDLFSPQLSVKDGKLKIPQGYGLGIHLDSSVLKRGYRIFEIR